MKILRYPKPGRLRALLGCLLLVPGLARAQNLPDSPPPPPAAPLTLPQVLSYALAYQPLVRQARLDEGITDAGNRVALAAWLPQVGVTGVTQHYFGLPYTIFPDPTTGIPTPRQLGVANVTTLGLSGTQVIYNNDVRLASRQAPLNRLAAGQNTVNNKIATVSDASKAFYSVLLSQRQAQVYDEDIRRLARNYQDARARYDAGIVDKTDYLQAEISLNNSKASRKQALEGVKANTAYLQQLMGFPATQLIALKYDTLQLEQEAVVDTLAQLDPANRIEYQQVLTQKSLQGTTVDYYRLGFLPSLSAFGNYNSVYQNNSVSEQYRQRFPNSYAGLQLALPLFTGFRRTQNLRRARLQDQRVDQDLLSTRNQVTTEYATALANYKGYFEAYVQSRQNLDLSRQVYKVVDLQYREGIKAYLDLLVAQTTLRTSQLNYYSALFQVLTSKVELLRTLGTLPTNY
ncbi:TolC family protein [Siccationidurans ginsengisoli]|uniref:TolC family protein n=1 Tax=Hymenobacter TaxID=89966 RepID=UPI001AAC4F1D|nr:MULTISPECIES: TolC family protein [unclassified Hymenobacter]MBO2030975.1 TolC family protein [Hymenobacter sp. BT559]